jgi:membrane-bound lytic murein transglycosylase B
VLPPVDPASRARLVAADIVPTFTAAQLTDAGAQLPDAARDFAGPLAFVELQNGDAPASYVAGTRNFYVVTRYNWSSYYAMAVIDLAAALKREMALAPAARTLAN